MKTGMAACVVRWLVMIGMIVAVPLTSVAQEATVGGRVTDSTGGVLPGVTVIAVHEASGNTFEAVSDATGVFRLPVRTGTYRLTAELPGFASVTRTVQLLVGQQAVVNLELAPSALQETVTVTGEAPLVDVTSSEIGGNIDPRQVSELPLAGRNWMNLTLLAPGARANAATEAPTTAPITGLFQFNVDGQQVTQNIQGAFGQPRFAQDSVAEFQFVANRFDATQGRSFGVQVNVITKSGTNNFLGTLGGYFRDDRFNAADHVVHRVLPYSNQQVSGTYGGPILRDKLHFFTNVEYEREPRTFTYSTPYPRFNFDLSDVRTERKSTAKMDYQLSPRLRVSARGTTYRMLEPYDQRFAGGATRTPSSAQGNDQFSDQIFGNLTQVVSSRALNEVKVGYNRFGWSYYSQIQNPNSLAGGKYCCGVGAPQINLLGLTIGQTQAATPQDFEQNNYSIRDDFSFSFTKAGRHDVRTGGEYIYQKVDQYICRLCHPGVLDANLGPVPGNIEDLFPDMFDVSTWNLNALSSITRRFRMGIGTFEYQTPRHISAFWLQDDWAATSRLTLNLGVRYDLSINTYSNDSELDPVWYPAGRPDDTDNIAPRLGAVYSLNERTVLRGGWGKFFGDETNPHAAKGFTLAAVPERLNDGRPDFASNPWNGPAPTFEQLLAAGFRREITTSVHAPDAQIPFSYQASGGLQRQIGASMAVEADYVYTGTRMEKSAHNINLSYNPATGANYPFTDISRRPYPNWGQISMTLYGGWSDYHALQTSFRRRLANGWQASGTYTLGMAKDAVRRPYSGLADVPFPLAADFGGEYTLAAGDQRHRAVFNGIWEAGLGFQVSGLYFFGSGERFSTNYGGDLRNASITEGRLRPDGTLVPRNNLVGEPLHRVDMRLQRRFQLTGRFTLTGVVEMFNVFNRANFGSYVTQESNRNYGQPTQNTNVAYGPRILQLGLRATF